MTHGSEGTRSLRPGPARRPGSLASSLDPARSPLLPLLLLVAGCVAQALSGHAHPDQFGHAWGLDDAFISYRYAQNLFEGRGLVFNEGVRVEGYSNFLFVLLTAPAFLFTGGMGVYVYATALNVLFAAATLLIWHHRMRREIPPHLLAIGAILLALTPPLWATAASGMESTLVLLVQVGVWAALPPAAGAAPARSILPLAGLLSISLLLRADGFLLTLIVVAYLIVKSRGREALSVLAILAAVAGAFLAWRYAYYGRLAPNTYDVKIAGPVGARLREGSRQILEIALQGGLLPCLLAPLLAAGRLAARAGKEGLKALGELPFEVFLALGTVSYWLYIGGDALGDRFLAPLVPLGLALLLREITPDKATRSLPLLVTLLFCLTLAPLYFDGRFTYSPSKEDTWVALGRHLGERHPGETLAVDAAGKIPFLSGLRTIDMLGLNEPELARRPVETFVPGHSKYDADYVLSKRPDLIATFIDPYNLDMSYGLWRAKYESAGYRVRYLAGGRGKAPAASILDVRGLDPDLIRRRILEGYVYAVLERARR